MRLWKLFALTAAAPLMMAAGQAHAFGSCDAPLTDSKHWVDPATVNAFMKSEGQKIVAYATSQNDFDKDAAGKGRMHGLVFTKNAAGDGHILETSEPIGTKAAKMCIAEDMATVEPLDARSEASLEKLAVSSTAAVAKVECANLEKSGKISKNSCGFINEMLTVDKNVKQYGLLKAFSVQRDGQGNAKKDQQGHYVANTNLQIAITANLSGHYGDNPNNSAAGIGGTIKYIRLPSGAAILAEAFLFPNSGAVAQADTPTVVAQQKVEVAPN